MNNDIKEILDYFRKYATIRENTMISKIEDYITNLQEDLANYVNVVLHDRKVIDDYKSRIDKAIELLEKYGNGTFDEDILNILQGSDKE